MSYRGIGRSEKIMHGDNDYGDHDDDGVYYTLDGVF